MVRFLGEQQFVKCLKIHLLCIVEHILWTQVFPPHHLISDGSWCNRINQINYWEAGANRFVLKVVCTRHLYYKLISRLLFSGQALS